MRTQTLSEYNAPTSVRHPKSCKNEGVKMYAELAGIKNCKKLGIKSLNGNIIASVMLKLLFVVIGSRSYFNWNIFRNNHEFKIRERVVGEILLPFFLKINRNKTI